MWENDQIRGVGMAIYDNVAACISIYNIQHRRPETFAKSSNLVKVKEDEVSCKGRDLFVGGGSYDLCPCSILSDFGVPEA